MHENLSVMTAHYVSTEPASESPEQKAVRLLNRQLEELQTVRALNYRDPAFKAWRDTTRSVLDRFLGPDSHHTTRFLGARFFGSMTIARFGEPMPQNFISKEDADAFQNACETTDASLRAAIRHVQDFGVYEQQAKPASTRRGRGRSGGVSQNFYGPTTFHSQAIATDGAIQKIGHMGDKTGASLKEIADLLQRSEDLTPRQVKEGLANIETLAVEVQKPEDKRNWKSILDCGQAVLDIADKAVDLGKKLAPYTPAILTLVDQAKHYIK